MLPGVALLVLSTSIRFGQVHEEIHRFEGRVPEHLILRATLFRNALVSLYAGVCCFAVASLVGGVGAVLDFEPSGAVLGLTGAGVAALAYAALTLVRESTRLLEVIRSHAHDGDHG